MYCVFIHTLGTTRKTTEGRTKNKITYILQQKLNELEKMTDNNVKSLYTFIHFSTLLPVKL